LLLLCGVYALGMLDLPTAIPYVAAILAIGADGIRTARRGRDRASAGRPSR
jgi:hypothetical protein